MPISGLLVESHCRECCPACRRTGQCLDLSSLACFELRARLACTHGSSTCCKCSAAKPPAVYRSTLSSAFTAALSTRTSVSTIPSFAIWISRRSSWTRPSCALNCRTSCRASLSTDGEAVTAGGVAVTAGGGAVTEGSVSVTEGGKKAVTEGGEKAVTEGGEKAVTEGNCFYDDWRGNDSGSKWVVPRRRHFYFSLT